MPEQAKKRWTNKQTNKSSLSPIPHARVFTFVLCSSLFESGTSRIQLRQLVIIVIQENARSCDMVVKVRTLV